MFCRWSTTRPGVPMMMWGLRARAMACVIMSTPPTITAVLMPMEAPNASNCSAIWKASSRVGASTREKRRAGAASSACRMGMAKAPVLPEPVSASPITSRPASVAGRDSAWMREGAAHLSAAAASHSASHTPSEAKVTGGGGAAGALAAALADMTGARAGCAVVGCPVGGHGAAAAGALKF